MSTTDEAGDLRVRQLRDQVDALNAAAARARDPELRRRLLDKARFLQEEGERRPSADPAPSR
ncbi:DUF6381 family protein [Streptomyces sp. NPDC001691]|uniref:DUF6381 family protein n=1 Tax=unclassified Streptomyces TaxID=2593676 RepID=UPI000DEB7C6F|nr:DUF6381 family protein [Streptomyces sp. SDr-06]RCH67799.1 hypothetical protein DT019_16275 [Streptomyces sp. SDr-06]